MDREAFRERFKAYKEGKPVSEIYDAGLPNYAGGKNEEKKSRFSESLGGKYLHVIDNTIDYLHSQGVDPMLIAGILGNMALESGFNPDSIGPGGFAGTVQMSSDMANEIKRAYGKVDYKTTNQFIHDAMSGNKKISQPWRNYMKQHGGYYGRTFNSAGDAAMAFGRVFERPNEKYANWASRMLSAEHALDYINLRIGTPSELIPVTQTTAAKYNAAHQFQPWSNYHLPDYSLNNPAPTMISSMNNTSSPTFTTPELQSRRSYNNIKDVAFDIMNGKDVEDALMDNLSKNVFGGRKIGFKNGKLPGYKDGTRYLWDDQKGEWDRITDSDVANAMALWAFTPTTTRAKFDYENTPNPILPFQRNETVSQDNNTWTKKRIEEESNKRTWRSDAADIANKIQIASDIASTVYGAGLTNTVKNKVIKPLIRSVVKNAPTTDVERRFIEVMLRSTGGKGSGIDMSTIKNSLLSDKKHSFDVLKYITTGKGDAISLLPGDIYTGFRVKKGWDLPSIKLPTDNKNLGDIIDAILYNRKINPEYGVIPTQEPLFDFGLTPNAIKRYNNVSRYKVKPEYDNSYGFGNVVPPSLYNNITEKHLPIVYDDYGKPTRPTSIAVATSNRIGADLGHYDMQIGNLNNYPVYRWQDIYEFNPSAYKKSWDLYNSDFGGDSKTVMRLKNIFLDRLDKAHNPVTILRDWFSDPFGWPAENYGFTIN